MRRVALLTTGGTISSRRSAAGAVVANDDAAALSSTVRRTGAIQVEVEARDVLRAGSYQLTLADLRVIAEAVADSLADPGICGVVVTHGTDTLEETAALLALVHDDERPVVLTGAQRAADVHDTDGPRNLTDAVAVAASPGARGLGVLVSFAGQVLPALGVRKAHTLGLSAFTNPRGAVGTVVDGDLVVDQVPRRPAAIARPTHRFDEIRVDQVPSYPGADGTLLRAAVGAGARGVVLVGTGVGNTTPALTAEAEKAIADGVVVALSSRVGDGPVVPIYGNGGGADLVAAGAVPVPRLPASQARIALALLLSHTQSPDEVRSQLAQHA